MRSVVPRADFANGSRSGRNLSFRISITAPTSRFAKPDIGPQGSSIDTIPASRTLRQVFASLITLLVSTLAWASSPAAIGASMSQTSVEYQLRADLALQSFLVRFWS